MKVLIHLYKKTFLFLICFLFLSSFSFSQVNNTTFSISNGTYTEITGGTVLGNTSSDDQYFLDPAVPLGSSTNTGVGFPIGFDFTINGNTFDRFGVQANGWIALGKSSLTPSVNMNSTSHYTPLSSTATITPTELRTRISALGKDLNAQTGAELSYLLTGTAPNRVLVVQWKNYRKYNASGEAFNFQILLYETSNTVKVMYGTMTSNSTSGDFQVGLGGSTATDFANVKNTTDWSTTLAPGTTNASTCTMVSGNTPASGLTFNWAPPEPMSFSSSTTTQVTGIIPAGAGNQAIIGVQVVTTGATTPISLTQLNLNTNGTTNTADLVNAKVYYTGTSNTFATSTQFGSTVATPNGAFTVTGDQVLASGTNYFWLAYDVSGTATAGDFVDAECTQVTVAGSTHTPDVTAPAGNREIKSPLSGSFTVGTSGNYTSITAALNDLNTLGVSGPVTLLLTDATYNESSYPVVFGNIFGTSSINTITIKPNTGVIATISGSSTSSIIKLNGAKYVIIDGSNNGSNSHNLTISNTAASGAVIVIASLGTGAGSNSCTIKNCIINAGAATSGSYGFAIGGSLPGNAGDDNDNITIQNNFISKAYDGIYVSANATGLDDNLLITGNEIGSNTLENYIGNCGIAVNGTNNAVISNNEIYNIITAASGDISGISTGINLTGLVISRNKIHDLQSNSTSGYGAFGINLFGTTNANGIRIDNNLIYKVNTTNYSTSHLTWNPFGIRIAGGTNHQIYYNSVNLSGAQHPTGTTGTLSAALLVTLNTVTGLDIRNNIFSNGIEGLTGSKSYCVYAPTGTTFGTIDHNDYHAFGTYGVLGYLGADKTTLADWQAATTQDANSKAVDPLFLASNDLRINTGSPMVASGTPITSVTIDYTGITRSATTPTIGAYEHALNGGPTITYTPLGNTYLIGADTLTAAITDADGVALGTYGPRVYWKVNSGAWTSASVINENPFTFVINTYGLAVGDVISYFIIAQDALGNVSANPGNDLVAANVLNITTYPSNPNTYTIVSNPNFGGGWPSSGGYYFANSTPGAYEAPSHPAYMWIDPVASGHTEITSFNTNGDDAFSPAIPIPFSFTYFGTSYSQLWVCTNCWISFSDMTSHTGTDNRTPVAIPTAGGIDNYIAGMLKDMNVTSTTYPDAHVYYGGDVNQFVITFNHAHVYGSATDYITFQIILKSNGNVKIQYNDTATTSPFPISMNGISTVGIENADGTAGIQYRFNGAGGPLISGAVAIEFGTNAGNLPVELTSFTAAAQDRNIVLNWETKTENNSGRFIVERSSKSGTWQEVSQIKASGNSTAAHKYSFTDKKLNSGKFSYRLKCVDLNGKFTYSNIAETEVELPKTYTLSQNYPNPFNPSTRIDYQLPVDARVTIELYSITGERVGQLVNTEQSAGYYTLDVNSSSLNKNLASGVYIYRMTAVGKDNGNNFVNVKKMMMLK